MKLCIFETGLPPEDIRNDTRSYPDMVADWLSPHLPEARFEAISAVRDAPMPAVESYDGYLLTGSKHGVYDDLPWIARLRDFLVEAKAAGRPIFGICFGHQLMAEAFGGTAKKSDRGWGVGVHDYTNEAGAGPGSGKTFVFHQDQVTEVPPRARVVGSAPHCPIGVVAYDFPALSVQYHPEFSREYMLELLDLRAVTVPDAIKQTARERLNSVAVDNDPTAVWAAEFFRRSVADLAA